MWPEWNGWLFQIAASSSLRVLIVAGLVVVLLATVRARAGGVRHAAWTAVLAAMLLMPLLPHFVPAIGIPIPAASPAIDAIAGASEAPDPVPPRPVQNEHVVNLPLAAWQAPAGAAQSSASSGAASADRAPLWPMIVLVVYGAGALFLLARLAVGWLLVRRVVETGSVIEVDGATAPPPHGALGRRRATLYESPLVSTPLTGGIIAPWIILPAAWRAWPEETLRAVLAHEFAHVRRRDPLVALAACVNRALFWFHPLAWWLERTLATSAEDACDEAAVRVAGTSRRYAEVLVEMAASVRRNRGRVAWQGVGVDGTGFLGQRINRVLKGEALREVSLMRKAIVAVGCAAAIILVVACRPQQAEPPPLVPDRVLAARWAIEQDNAAFSNAARAMTAAQVADLEAVIKKNPDDLDALKRLLIVYSPIKDKAPDGTWSAKCAQVIGEKECIAARRAHILRLIDKHPDHELAGGWGARLYLSQNDPLVDPVGYAQAKKLWLEKTAPKDASVAVLQNAARFFEVPDKALAEQMLLRLQAADPKGNWSASLGRLYALIIMGSDASVPLNVVWTVSPPDAHGTHAQTIRRKLAETTDTTLLLAAAEYLDFNTPAKLDFDTRALAATYVDRVLELDGQSTRARTMKVRWAIRDRNQRMRAALKDVPKDKEYEVVSALSEADRFAWLPWRAEETYLIAEGIDEWERKDLAAAQAGRERSRKYAEDALRLAEKFRNDPNYGTAIFRANVTLGTIAMRNGDKATAVKYLREAMKASASEELAYYGDMMWTRLVVPLLKYGERDSVAEFLETYAKLSVVDRERREKDAAAIRAGQMPGFYQGQTTRRGAAAPTTAPRTTPGAG